MGLLIAQCVVILFTAYISINSLKEDLKSDEGNIQKDAIKNRNAIRIVTLISIGISITTYFNSDQDKKESKSDFNDLKNNYKAIRSQNDSLRIALSNKLINTSNLITKSQITSAKQLSGAANRLDKLITGSKIVPKVGLLIFGDSTVTAVIKNFDSKPVYNLYLTVFNFENLEKCKTINNKNGREILIYSDCFEVNRRPSEFISVLSPISDKEFRLPNYKSKSVSGKFSVNIIFNNKFYIEELIYQFVDNKLHQSLRILELNRDLSKILNKEILFNQKAYAVPNLNWDKEFPQQFEINLSIVKNEK